jgi:HSP20 family molecular chaperone IbpA
MYTRLTKGADMLDRLLESKDLSFKGLLDRLENLKSPIFSPWDSYRYEDNVLSINVPGFSKEDLEITLEDNVLKIQGSKKIDGEDLSIKKEFHISSELLNTISVDSITADVKDGRLKITFPEKKEEPKVKKVKVL